MKTYNIAVRLEELFIIRDALAMYRDLAEDMANDDGLLEQDEMESTVIIIDELLEDIDTIGDI